MANGKAWNKYQYIERKGNPIAILSSKYQVLPNELVIEKADQIAQEVKEFAEKTGGQIYTQVDGETDRVYARGLRFVNRTGLYEVVKLEGYTVDNS